MALTAKDILKRKSKVHSFTVEGLGEVLCKPFTGSSLKKYQVVKDPADLMIMCVILSVCDESGDLLFSEEDFEAVAENFEFSELQQITNEVMQISGLIDPKS